MYSNAGRRREGPTGTSQSQDTKYIQSSWAANIHDALKTEKVLNINDNGFICMSLNIPGESNIPS